MGVLVLNNQTYSGNENNGHLYGEEIPRAEQGTEGSVYFQYTCTQSEDEEGQIIRIPNDIVCVYSKIDGQWIPWDEDDVPEVHGAYSVVIPNPPGPSDSGDLTKIKIDGSTFDVGGGGGTEVVANPSGEATAQLQSIKIDNIIYDWNNDVRANQDGEISEDLLTILIGDKIYRIPVNDLRIIPNPQGTSTGELSSIGINGDIYDIVDTGNIVIPNPSGGSSTNLLKVSIDGTIYKVGDDYSKVEGNPSSGTVVGNLDSIKIDGDVYNIDNNVEANPIGTPTDTLTTVSIDNTIYEIDGGNEVEANPSGTATDTLTTISVDGTIYDIPGTGTELPENYNPNQQYLRITSPDEYNELGWGVSNDTYYFDTAAEWYLGNRRTIKSNATPALGAIAKVGNYYNNCLVSTNADATNHLVVNYYETKQHYSFEYKGHTWYWSGAEWGLPNASGSSGIQVLSGSYDSYETVAKYLIDQSEVYFSEYQDTFTQVGTPLSGHLFVGGGEESDYSDATFDVERDGTIHGKELQVGSTTTVNDTTWAKKMNYQEITRAAYDQLTPAQKQDITFFITDEDAIDPETYKIDELFDYEIIKNEAYTSFSLTSNQLNLIDTINFNSTGFYFINFNDNYSRTSNRSDICLQKTAGEILIFNNGGDDRLWDVLCDITGYSEIHHNILLKVLVPNTTVTLSLWGQGYNPNSGSLKVYKLRGFKTNDGSVSQKIYLLKDGVDQTVSGYTKFKTKPERTQGDVYERDGYIELAETDSTYGEFGFCFNDIIPINKYQKVTVLYKYVSRCGTTNDGVYCGLDSTGGSTKSCTYQMSSINSSSGTTAIKSITYDLAGYNKNGVEMYFNVCSYYTTAYIYDIYFE